MKKFLKINLTKNSKVSVARIRVKDIYAYGKNSKGEVYISSRIEEKPIRVMNTIEEIDEALKPL